MFDRAPSDTGTSSQWTYVQVFIIDGARTLRPTHICGTEIRFAEPPRLESSQITIITRNGDRETTRKAIVLAHHPDAIHIPIKLIEVAGQTKASTRFAT